MTPEVIALASLGDVQAQRDLVVSSYESALDGDPNNVLMFVEAITWATLVASRGGLNDALNLRFLLADFGRRHAAQDREQFQTWYDWLCTPTGWAEAIEDMAAELDADPALVVTDTVH